MINLYGFGGALFAGALITVKVSLVALILGLCFGLIGATAKLSRFFVFRLIADIYTTIVRGVPELILILTVYFGGGVLINSILSNFNYQGYIEINSFVSGVITLGLAFGAYATEVFRSAILSIHTGQIEAAKAIGMNGFLRFRRITLPQVWRLALPALGNLFLILQKNSALVSVIGLNEIMRNATIATSFTKKPFVFYFAAAIIYLVLTIFSTICMQYMEHHFSRGVRRD